MPTPTLTQTGADNFNRADSSTLGATDWYVPTGSPVPTSPGISSNMWYAEGSSTAECCWNHTVTQDQYCEITFEGNHTPGPANQFVDQVFRRSRSNPSAFYFFSATQGQSGGGLVYLADNLGTLDTPITLNTALAIGDVLQVAVVGTQVWVWQNGTQVSGSLFSLPTINPTGSTGDAYDLGLNGSAYLLLDNWFVGTAALPAVLRVTDINGNWTDSAGNSFGGGAQFTYNHYGTALILGSAPPGSAIYNTAFASQSLTISNSGGSGSLPFTVATTLTNPKRWLIVSPASGDCGSTPMTVTVEFNPNGDDFVSDIFGLKDGTFSANVVVTAGAQQIIVPVTLVLAKYPSRAGY